MIVIFGIVHGAAFVLCHVITLSCVRDYKGNKEFLEFTLGFASNKRNGGGAKEKKGREKERKRETERKERWFCRKFSASKLRTYFLYHYNVTP